MIKRILFAADLGAFTSYALTHVEGLAVQYGAKVSIVHVVQPLGDLASAVVKSYCSDEVKKELLDVAGISGLNDTIRDRVFDLLSFESNDGSRFLSYLDEVIVCSGNPAAIILDEAYKRNADLIIIGSHGNNPVAGHILGSVASKVLQLARRPVYMIPMMKPLDTQLKNPGPHSQQFGT